MDTTNWPRVLLCGLVAGFVWAVLSIVLVALVGGDFQAALPGRRLEDAGGALHLFLLWSNLAAAIWALWLYTAIRPRYGPGPKTAAIAGLAWWIIVSLQSAKWVALVAVSPSSTLAPLAATLPATLVAVLVGAWFYEK